MSHTNQAQDATTYFNLHASGIGYLNRIREVPVRRGPSFLACDIVALHGASNAVEYLPFDCRVSGTEAERLIRQHWGAVKAGQKVLLSFRIGDPWIKPFLYEKGDKQGQPGASLKGRLLFIDWIKVDGELVYKAPARQEATAPAEQAPSDEPTEEPAGVETDEPASTTDEPAESDPVPSAHAVRHDALRAAQPA